MKPSAVLFLLFSAMISHATAFTSPLPCPGAPNRCLSDYERRCSRTTKLYNALVGNPYLNSLERQTIEASSTSALVDKNPTAIDVFATSLQETKEEATTKHDKNNETKPQAAQLMNKIKEAGTAGIISFALVQVGFWSASFALATVAYVKVMGHLPDFSDEQEMKTLGAEAFAYVNVARLAAPLRIAFALSSTSWVQENLLDRFGVKSKNDNKKEENHSFDKASERI